MSAKRKPTKRALPGETSNVIELPLMFYDGRRYILDTGDDFIPMSKTEADDHLEFDAGLPDRAARREGLCTIRRENFVHIYSNLAGHARGLHDIGGKRWLVPDSPPLVEPKRGSWKAIARTLGAFCGVGSDDHGKTQYNLLLGHLKTQMEARRRGVHRPGPVFWLAGPPDAGKTTVVELIVGGVLGRVGDAHKYLSGGTRFNGDLVDKEVWVLDDKHGDPRIELRRKVGDNTKSATFGKIIELEAKHAHGLHARPVISIFGCCNLEPDALRALPPLERDLINKNVFLLCHAAGIPGGVEFDPWRAEIQSELPAFAYALERFEIPPELEDPRCGVRAFQHPAILEIIREQSPENQLVGLILEMMPSMLRSDADETAGVYCWEGTAAALRDFLGSRGRGSAIQSIVGGSAVKTGSLLAHIESDGGFPVEVERRIVSGVTRWTITARAGAVVG